MIIGHALGGEALPHRRIVGDPGNGRGRSFVGRRQQVLAEHGVDQRRLARGHGRNHIDVEIFIERLFKGLTDIGIVPNEMLKFRMKFGLLHQLTNTGQTLFGRIRFDKL